MDASDLQRDLRAAAGQCLALKVRQASRVLTAHYDEALRPHGLKASQLNLLVMVGALGGARPAELCRRLDLEKSSLSRGAERLEAGGWLERRRPARGRGLRYHLSRTGRRRLERALADWRGADARARRRLGRAGVQALESLLGELAPGA